MECGEKMGGGIGNGRFGVDLIDSGFSFFFKFFLNSRIIKRPQRTNIMKRTRELFFFFFVLFS